MQSFTPPCGTSQDGTHSPRTGFTESRDRDCPCLLDQDGWDTDLMEAGPCQSWLSCPTHADCLFASVAKCLFLKNTGRLGFLFSLLLKKEKKTFCFFSGARALEKKPKLKTARGQDARIRHDPNRRPAMHLASRLGKCGQGRRTRRIPNWLQNV